MALDKSVALKYDNLKKRLAALPSLLVAYSGGIDSTLLLKVAVDVLGDRACGVIGLSPSLPQRELREAEEIAQQFSLPYVLIETHELEDENYRANPLDRCYYCKRELFSEIYVYARQRGFRWIADGTNADDQGDYRPGRQAAEELRVISPLMEAGLGKRDIRLLARHLGLPNWNKPAMACLSSRIPTGTAISEETLRQIEKAEDFLLARGFRVFRVRHHGDLARIEVDQEELPRFLDADLRKQVVEYFKNLGYVFVTLDLMGYRRGSLNELIHYQRQIND